MGCGGSTASPKEPSTANAPKKGAPKDLNFELKRKIEINASADATWAKAKDWGLQYLLDYDSSVKVTVSEADGKKLRSVELLGGVIEERLLDCDDDKRTLQYEMIRSFLPYASHSVVFSVLEGDGGKSIIDWTSKIKAQDDVDKAKRVAEEGLNGAVLVFKQKLGS